MRTVYGRLTALILVLVIALMLFAPMRSGLEDRLYAYPHSIRMNRGDSYDITYALDSDRAQRVSYTSVNEDVARVSAEGRITAVNPGATDIHLDAEGGAKTTVHVEVAGTPTTALVLNTDSVTMEKGEVTGLRARFNDGADDTRVEWRSMDDRVASVDAIGRVTAVRGGRTTVYAATPNGLTAGADIFVHVSGTAVRITPEDLTVGAGARLKMGANYFPDDATDSVVRWTSSDPRLMTVDADGTIHALDVGRAVLSLFTDEGLSNSMVINIERPAERFDLSPSAATIERGDSINLEARFLNAEGQVDEQASEHYIAWTSGNPDVATVDDEGCVTAIRSGTTEITASADGMTAVCSLRVQVLVHEITLDQSEIFMLREDTAKPIQVAAALTPDDPDDPTLTWLTSNDLVANVDPNGLVTMTGGYGTAVITARAASGAEAHFTVNVVAQLPEPEVPAEDADAAAPEEEVEVEDETPSVRIPTDAEVERLFDDVPEYQGELSPAPTPLTNVDPATEAASLFSY